MKERVKELVWRLLEPPTYVPDVEAHRLHDKAVMDLVIARHACVWVRTHVGIFCRVCDRPGMIVAGEGIMPYGVTVVVHDASTTDDRDPYFLPGSAA